MLKICSVFCYYWTHWSPFFYLFFSSLRSLDQLLLFGALFHFIEFGSFPLWHALSCIALADVCIFSSFFQSINRLKAKCSNTYIGHVCEFNACECKYIYMHLIWMMLSIWMDLREHCRLKRLWRKTRYRERKQNRKKMTFHAHIDIMSSRWNICKRK